MGKPKFSGIGTVDMQNSIGNTTYSRNRYGTYSKQKPPTPPSTIWLATWQASVSAIQALWPLLSDSDRQLWYSWAIKRKNQMAGTKIITGHESFMSVNLNRFLVGSTALATPPTYSPVSQLGQPVLSTGVGPTMFLDLGTWDTSTTGIALYFTVNLSPGRMSVNQIYFYCGFTFITGFQSVGAIYNARLAAITSGMKIFVKCVPINFFTGARGVAKFASCIN